MAYWWSCAWKNPDHLLFTMNIFRYLLFPLLLCPSLLLAAPGNPDPLPSSRWALALDYQDMLSTHRTHFRGGSILLSRPLHAGWSVGLGLEYAAAPYHDDNGYNLYRLRFVPVTADAGLQLPFGHSFLFLSRIAAGLSFAKYQQEAGSLPGQRTVIREKGLFLQGSLGVGYQVSRRLTPLIMGGIKGFHMSTNNLDVNPHGVTFRAGIQWNIF